MHACAHPLMDPTGQLSHARTLCSHALYTRHTYILDFKEDIGQENGEGAPAPQPPLPPLYNQLVKGNTPSTTLSTLGEILNGYIRRP